MQASKAISNKVKIIIATGRSGSTALLNCISQSDHIAAFYQPIKSSIRDYYKCNPNLNPNNSNLAFIPDYSIYYDHVKDDKIVVLKETLGSRNIAECDYPIFPTESRNEAIYKTKPFFLFRDPLEVMNSKQLQNWKIPLELSARAYHNVFLEWEYCSNFQDETICCTFNKLSSDPEQVLRKLCNYWNIPFEKEMLHWSKPFPNSIFGKDDFFELIEKGAFDGIIKAKTLIPKKKDQIIMDPKSISRIIEGDLSYLYSDFSIIEKVASKIFN